MISALPQTLGALVAASPAVGEARRCVFAAITHEGSDLLDLAAGLGPLSPRDAAALGDGLVDLLFETHPDLACAFGAAVLATLPARLQGDPAPEADGRTVLRWPSDPPTS